MISPARIAILVGAVAALVSALAATGASAARVYGEPGTIEFSGIGSEKNVVDIYTLNGEVVVNEEGKNLGVFPAGTCHRHPSYPDATQVAVCPVPQGTTGQPKIIIDTGQGNDFVHVYTYSDLQIRLGAGNDKLIAYDNQGPAAIDGGDGNDVLTGTGVDPLTHLGFNDLIMPGEGADKVAWGLSAGYGLSGSDEVDLAENKPKSDKVQCDGGDTVRSRAKQDKTLGC
jgi:hypothetical protein